MPAEAVPISIGRIVRGSLGVYRQTWWPHVLVATVLQAPVLVPTLALLSLLLDATVAVLLTRTVEALSSAAILAVAQLGLAFVSAFLFVLLGGAACQLVAAWSAGTVSSVRTACGEALARFWQLAGALLGAFAVVVGALLAVGSFLALGYLGFLVVFQVDLANDPRVFWVAFWMTALAAVVAGYVLVDAMVRWAVFVQVVMLENVSPVAALRRSATLVRPQWLRTLAVMLLLMGLSNLVTLVIALLLNVGFILIGQASHLTNGIGAAIAQILVMPIPAIGVTLLYFELVGTRPPARAAATGLPPEGAMTSSVPR